MVKCNIQKAEPKLVPLEKSGDIYSLAFKAMNYTVIQELQLESKSTYNAFQSALAVFGFQMI